MHVLLTSMIFFHYFYNSGKPRPDSSRRYDDRPQKSPYKTSSSSPSKGNSSGFDTKKGKLNKILSYTCALYIKFAFKNVFQCIFKITKVFFGDFIHIVDIHV